MTTGTQGAPQGALSSSATTRDGSRALALAHLRAAREARVLDRDPHGAAFFLNRAAAALRLHDDDDSRDLVRALLPVVARLDPAGVE